MSPNELVEFLSMWIGGFAAIIGGLWVYDFRRERIRRRTMMRARKWARS